jgi:hypothetical protein
VLHMGPENFPGTKQQTRAFRHIVRDPPHWA